MFLPIAFFCIFASRLYKFSMKIEKKKELASRGKGLWKFNNSLLLNEEFVTKIRRVIHLKINEINHGKINDDQIRWEFLKYEVTPDT